MILSHVSNGHSSQLWIREPQDEGSIVHAVENDLHVLFSSEAHDVSLAPGTSEMVAGEDHGAVEPLPEGEVTIRQRLSAELGPGDALALEHVPG